MRLTYANVTSSIALFLALGGTSYAVTKLPRNSVGAPQIKSNAVTGTKVKNGSLTAGDFAAGSIPAGRDGARGPRGEVGPTGPQGAQGTQGAQGVQGPIGTSGPYHFKVTKTNTQTLTGGQGNGVTFQTVEFDPSHSWSDFRQAFIAPVAGVYSFSARADLYGGMRRTFITIGRDKGGGIRGADMNMNGFQGDVATGLMHLDKGDAAAVSVYSETNDTVGPGQDVSFFSGFLVAAD